MLADLGFGAYRFSLEWSRIEPEEGEFSTARARPLPAHDRHDAATSGCSPSSRSTTSRRRAGPWPTAAGPIPRSSTGSRGSASGPSPTSATRSAWRCTINEPNIVSLMGWLVGAFPPGHHDLGEYATGERAPEGRAPPRVRRDQVRPGRLPGRLVRRDGRLVGAGRRRGDARADPRDARGPAPRSGGGDDFIGVQAYSRHPAHRPRACPTVPSRASRCSTWATSTGRRRSR